MQLVTWRNAIINCRLCSSFEVESSDILLGLYLTNLDQWSHARRDSLRGDTKKLSCM